MLINPAEQFLLIFFIIFSTSSLFVCCSINCSVGNFSWSDLIKVLMSENLFGDFPVTRSYFANIFFDGICTRI